MLAYFRTPFLAPNDHEVQAAISIQLIRGDQLDWKAAPHQFELWTLGGVDQEEGIIETEQTLICTLDSLIRTSVREDGAEQPGTGAPADTPRVGQSSPERPESTTSARLSDISHKAPTETLKRKKAHRGTRRSNKGS